MQCQFTFHSGRWVLDSSSPEFVERHCPLRWCPRCHGPENRPTPPPHGSLPVRPLAILGKDGRVLSPVEGRWVENEDAILRRRDGSVWIIGPSGLLELERVGAQWRGKRHRFLSGLPVKPWFVDADDNVWIAADDALWRVRLR